MKRIIDGKTFNTDTATELVVRSNEHSFAWWGLYQTREGMFFEVQVGHDNELERFRPLTDAEAQRLVEERANHLVEKYFDGPFPEGGAAEKRLTVRLPINLASRVEAAANQVSLSVNAYVMRCLERCVSRDGLPPIAV